jgi:hypothetical protein
MADIPIDAIPRRVQFTGNTGLGPFAFTFNILAAADIAVYKNATLLTITTDYTVSLNANGTGSVTLTGAGSGTALVAADYLTIIGDLPLARTTDFTTAGDLLASALNDQLDASVVMTQQISERVDRALRQDPNDVDGDMTIPAKADRLNKILRFNVTTGNPEVISLASGATSAANVSFTQAGTGAIERTVEQKLNESVSVLDFGADPTGVADSAAAINAAFAAGKNNVYMPAGVYKILSTVTIADYCSLRGAGHTSENGTSDRAATVILKSFNGVGLIVGDNCVASDFQVEGDAGNTGDGIQVLGGRSVLRNIQSNKHDGDGIRIGDDNNDAINVNLWRLDNVMSIYNTGHGLYIHHTNSNIDATYPLGLPDVNAGTATQLDLRQNGGDGLRIYNAIDNKFYGTVAQNNGGNGVKLLENARGHNFYGLYTEANLAYEMIIDSGANQNLVIGNRFVTTSSGWVDNGAANFILEHNGNIPDAYAVNKALAIKNFASGGTPALDFYSDTNAGLSAAIFAEESGTTGGKLTIRTKRDGDTGVDRFSIDDDGLAVLQNTSGMLFGKTVIDTTTAGIHIGDVGNVPGTNSRINMVGTGTAADVKVAFYNANGQVGRIETSGSATNYVVSSDYRLKTNAIDADGETALASVMSWPIKTFEWIADGSQDVGVIAHELEAVKPRAVSGEKDAMRNGEIEPQGVDYSKLVPELVAAVQYLANRVKQLES